MKSVRLVAETIQIVAIMKMCDVLARFFVFWMSVYEKPSQDVRLSGFTNCVSDSGFLLR